MHAHAERDLPDLSALPDLDAIVASLEGQPLHALVAHWVDLFKQRDAIPRRKDLDPLQFPRLLKHAWIFDAEPDGDIRVSLAGETFTDWYGFNPMGRSLRDICRPSVLEVIEDFVRRIVDTPAILLHSVQSVMPNWDEPAGFIRIGLPLAGAGGTVCHVLGATLFDKRYFNGLGAVSSSVTKETSYRIHGFTAAAQSPHHWTAAARI
ncbi:MAG: PAS domain-containing protein [Ferrovibrio sp.]